MSMANRHPPLHERQLEVLRWIADGCPAGVMEGYTHKTTAQALQNRHLVTVSRRRGAWSATLTDEGRYYLEHGRYQPQVLTGAASTHTASEKDQAAPPSDLAVRAAKALATKKKRPLRSPRQVEKREVHMRYRVLATRVQVAERWVRATDEEDAAKKVQAEFEKPYGYFGAWKTTTSEVEVVEAEQVVTIQPNPLASDGPLLLSLKDAAKSLGISYSMLYELTNRGDIEYTTIGTRKYVSRDTLMRFIADNTHRGYHR